MNGMSLQPDSNSYHHIRDHANIAWRWLFNEIQKATPTSGFDRH